MEKIYQVSLFDSKNGGHLLGEVSFAHAKEARREFVRIREIIKDKYNPYRDEFCRYENADYDLRLKVKTLDNKIDFEIPDSTYPAAPIKTTLWRINSIFKERLMWNAKPKDIYDAISWRFKVKNVICKCHKNGHTATYTIELPGYNRDICVYVDFRKERYVISGQPWHGYIMPEKQRTSRGFNLAVWYKWQK